MRRGALRRARCCARAFGGGSGRYRSRVLRGASPYGTLRRTGGAVRRGASARPLLVGAFACARAFWRRQVKPAHARERRQQQQRKCDEARNLAQPGGAAAARGGGVSARITTPPPPRSTARVRGTTAGPHRQKRDSCTVRLRVRWRNAVVRHGQARATRRQVGSRCSGSGGARTCTAAWLARPRAARRTPSACREPAAAPGGTQPRPARRAGRQRPEPRAPQTRAAAHLGAKTPQRERRRRLLRRWHAAARRCLRLRPQRRRGRRRRAPSCSRATCRALCRLKARRPAGARWRRVTGGCGAPKTRSSALGSAAFVHPGVSLLLPTRTARARCSLPRARLASPPPPRPQRAALAPPPCAARAAAPRAPGSKHSRRQPLHAPCRLRATAAPSALAAGAAARTAPAPTARAATRRRSAPRRPTS